MLKITYLPAFHDNYIWILEQAEGLIVIDPGQSEQVIAHAKQLNKPILAILVTHHHQDHSGGIVDIIEHFPQVQVYAGAISKLPYVTHNVQAGDRLSVFGVLIDVLDLSGHTLDHVGYFMPELYSDVCSVPSEPIITYHTCPQSTLEYTPCVFTGDALFSMGCGRVFEGTSEQMTQVMLRLNQLPDETHVYCGHEYTVSNLKWALSVDPYNEILQRYARQMIIRCEQRQATLPSRLYTEKQLNPFLRLMDATIQASVMRYANTKELSIHEVFSILRSWKNDF
ncbi:MAG: hydroxyacylglutathione hydrolase [Alcaligenaceae bacterium]|nr:hydroxyacylglutathione hydrolase [Alcaligenaceae bacterium]